LGASSRNDRWTAFATGRASKSRFRNVPGTFVA
jgi:hypothetical protein